MRAGSPIEAGFVRRPPGPGSPRQHAHVELVPVEGWIEADRGIKEPAELERVAAACAVADRALATLACPRSARASPNPTLALRLEWLIRTGGAEALAFDVACLSGPEAALPHGSPGDRPGPRRQRPAVRLRRPGRRLPQRHDPDAVRRGAVRVATSRSTSWSRGHRPPPSRRSRLPSSGSATGPGCRRCPAAGQSMRPPAR